MNDNKKTIVIEDAVNGYVDLANHVLKYGNVSTPRGLETKELEDATIHIADVFNVLPIGVGRGIVPGIAAVEALQIIGGVTAPNIVLAVAPQFAKYIEPDGHFHGAYGLRTAGQYDIAVERLKQDRETRQAVVTIWNPQIDSVGGKNDYPCTLSQQFRIRNNKLNMTVHMRSNDVWLGAAYDFFQFTRVQIAIASILGIEPGTYAHHVGSLHIYKNNYESVEKLTHTSSRAKIPSITGRSWREISAVAFTILQSMSDTSILPLLNESEQWYATSMINAIKASQESASKQQ